MHIPIYFNFKPNISLSIEDSENDRSKVLEKQRQRLTKHYHWTVSARLGYVHRSHWGAGQLHTALPCTEESKAAQNLPCSHPDEKHLITDGKITDDQPQLSSFTVRRAGLCCIHKRSGMPWLQLKLCKSRKMDLQRFCANFTGIQVCVIPSSAHWALFSACWNWLSGS